MSFVPENSAWNPEQATFRARQVGQQILQHGWIHPETLKRAFQEWARKPQRPFAHWLAQRGLLSPLQVQELERGSTPLVSPVAQSQVLAPSFEGSDEITQRGLGPAASGVIQKKPTPSFSAKDFQPGQVFGPYLIEEALSRGGMGLILKVKHRGLDITRALKVLFDHSPRPEDIERFKREAQVLAKLRHPNILQVSDFGIEKRIPFYAMDFIDGENLRQVVDKNLRERHDHLDPKYLLTVMADLARALAYCHSKGIIHRDLKPHNVLIENHSDRCVLCDFGLLKRTNSVGDSTGTQLTKTGEVWGTPAYMSPEQIFPDGPYGRIGAHTDVWGLGATMFYAFTGTSPYPANNLADVCDLLQKSSPQRVREIRPECPAWIDTLISQCLRRSCADRTTLYEILKTIQKHSDLSVSIPDYVSQDGTASAPEWEEQGSTARLQKLGLGLMLGLLMVLSGVLIVGLMPKPAELIHSQLSSSLTGDEQVIVQGLVRPPGTTVILSGTPVKSDSHGRFQYQWPLLEGENTLTLRFLNDKSILKTFKAHRDTKAPVVEIFDVSNPKNIILQGKRRLRLRVNDQSPGTVQLGPLTQDYKSGQILEIAVPDELLSRDVRLVVKDQLGHKCSVGLFMVSPKQMLVVLNKRRVWGSLGEALQDQIIQVIADSIKEDFAWKSTDEYQCNGLKHRIASFVHKPTQIEFMLLPGGQYRMGFNREREQQYYKQQINAIKQQQRRTTDKSTKRQLAQRIRTLQTQQRRRYPQAEPMRIMTVPAFLISRFEISKRQFSLLKGEALKTENSSDIATRIPNVLELLKILKRWPLRLPSEAEWEYACRAGSQDRFFWGPVFDARYCWYRNNSGNKIHNIYEHRNQANAFGLSDMVGNVSEVCRDWFFPNYKAGPVNYKARIQEPQDGSIKMTIRGTHYFDIMNNLASYYRRGHISYTEARLEKMFKPMREKIAEHKKTLSPEEFKKQYPNGTDMLDSKRLSDNHRIGLRLVADLPSLR